MEDIPSRLIYCLLFKMHSDNINVTLLLSFATVFLIHTAFSQATQEYPRPFCLNSPSYDLLFIVTCSCPSYVFSLAQFYSHSFTSLCSSQGYFISQPRLTNTSWICGSQPLMSLFIQHSLTIHTKPWAKPSPCSSDRHQK